MATTYETNVNNNNNNNAYEEVDNFSETSKDYPSSASSSVDDTKKVNKKISFDDNKEEKNGIIKNKKRNNSFRKMFNKEKDQQSEGFLSGIFNNKDNKRNGSGGGNPESEKHLRSTSRSSSNSDTSKNRRSFVFCDDDEKQLEIDINNTKKGRKSRASSNAEGFDKDKSTKKGRRISVNISKLLGLDDKSSQKSTNSKNVWEDNFLEPDEPIYSPKNSLYSSKKQTSNNTLNKDYVESPIGTDFRNSPKSQDAIADDSPIDDIQSTNSSTQPSSVDDQDFNQKNSFDNIINNKPESEYNSGSPTTPKLIVTPIDNASFEFTSQDNNKSNDQNPGGEQDEKEDTKRTRNIENLTITTNDINSNDANVREQKNDNNFMNTNSYDDTNEQVSKKLQELEEMNKSLNEQLEAKVAEQNSQINKYNAMENSMVRIMQTMQRLESKVDQQNEELVGLKYIVGQLTGENPQLLITNGDSSQLRRITQGEDQNILMAKRAEERALIQANHSQLQQNYSRSTLVNTLVVSPLYNTITISASIATSVLYAVYVRPVVGIVKVLRSKSETAG